MAEYAAAVSDRQINRERDREMRKEGEIER